MTFVGHTGRSGSGTGLYSIDAGFNLEKHEESVVGTYANRWIHSATDQVCLGPHLIHADGSVRTVPGLVDHRLTATMDHHEDIINKVSYLTMEGLILELDLNTLEVKTIFNLMKEIGIPPGKQPHFKGAYCNNGEIIVANNSFDEPDYRGEWTGGMLAEYKDGEWTILDKSASLEIYGRRNFGNVVFASGWDRKSCYLRVKQDGEWRKYRIPKSSACYEHMWNTEWCRIRELERERYIADIHGGFFELSPTSFGKTTIVRLISTHLRCVTDITMFKGLVVMGFRVGSLMNVYDEDTMAYLANCGATHFSLPPELPEASVNILAQQAKQLGVTTALSALPIFDRPELYTVHNWQLSGSCTAAKR